MQIFDQCRRTLEIDDLKILHKDENVKLDTRVQRHKTHEHGCRWIV